jgi:glycosyltransferase involved in cell wall biosynthesis
VIYPLAIDALESVKSLPSSAFLWQHLSSLINVLKDDDHSELIDKVILLSFDNIDARWLQYSALAYLTGDFEWLVKQSALVGSNMATDAIVNLLCLAWHHALVGNQDRDSFFKNLQDLEAVKLQGFIAERLPFFEGPKRMIESPLRLAIYTPQILNSRHGGTFFTLNVMSMLTRYGLSVQAFSAQEATIQETFSYCGGENFLTPLSVDTASLKLNVPGSVQIMLPDTAFSLRFRYEQMLSAIHSYAPDLIIFVGFMSPMIYKLYTHYPVLGLSVHTLAPIVPIDIWLKDQQQEEPKFWQNLPIPEVVDFPFRFWPNGPTIPFDWVSRHIPASAVVLVSVGYRLGMEMTQSWLEHMLSFLEAHQQVHWLLIGSAETEVLASLPRHARIHIIEPQANIDAWLAACDIYVNPPRMGGGGSVAMAMEKGLPVVSFAGSDGGDKVGEWAVSSMCHYFDLLTNWVLDATAREQTGNALKDLFHSRLDISSERALDSFMLACQSAITSFNQRVE